MAKTKAMIAALPDIETVKAEILKYHQLAKTALAAADTSARKNEEGLPIVAGDRSYLKDIAIIHMRIVDALVEFLPHRDPAMYAWLKSHQIDPNVKGILPWPKKN